MRCLRLSWCVVLLFSSQIFAAQLKVTVTDPHSMPISGATVSLFAAGSTQPAAIQQTSAEGVAQFGRLDQSEYHIEVLAPGFSPARRDVNVAKNDEAAVQLSIAVPGQAVVVTATRTPVPAEQSEADVELLDSPALENMQPMVASDALRFLPGAIVNTVGRIGGQASLFVRGGESRYNKVIIDGVPVNEPGGTYDFGVLPLMSFDRLEFVRGAESVLYGSDAMTSVVQFWTTTGHTRVPEIRFGADGGNYGTARGYGDVAGAVGRFDYNLFGQQDATEGRGIDDAYSNSLEGANVGVALSNNVAARLRVRHANSRSGVQGEWNFNGQPLLAPDSDAFARQNNLIASAEVSVIGPSRWQHRFTGFEYRHNGLNRDTVVDPGRGCDPASFIFTDCFFSAPFRMNRAGLEYQGDWSVRAWAHTTFGYRFEDEHAAFDSAFLSADFTQFPPLTFIGTSHTQGVRRNHGLYLEQTVSWRRFTLLAGGRFEHNESFGNKGIPRAAVSFLAARGGNVLSGTRFRAAYAEGIVEPTFQESFGNIGTFPADPNPNLKPEQNRSLEAGAQQNFFAGKYSLNATYYNNLFRDLIEFKSGPNFIGGQFVNIAKSVAHGAELELRGRITQALMLSAAYVYTSSQVLANPLAFDPFLPGEPLIRRPKHSGSLLLNYFGRRWGGELGGSFVGRRADSDFLGLGINHTAGYARIDLGGWLAVSRQVTAYVNLGNVLDKQYEEVAGYPSLGTTLRAGVRFRVGGE
jgi:vitamin B12 transporter